LRILILNNFLIIYLEKTRIIRKLFQHGARFNELDKKGRTALDLAYENKKENIAKMIADNNLYGRCVFSKSLVIKDNSFLNFYLYIILHLSVQIICLLYLLPSKKIRI
jgi:ankyrin repeat protein